LQGVPINEKTGMIVEIKAVKIINTKGVISVQITDYGWSFV